MARYLIIGLGNPGRRYEHTRHNIGFLAVDAFAAASDASPWKSGKQSLVCTSTLYGHQVLLAKPQLFMNNSGIAIQTLARYHQIAPDAIMVIGDDLDLPFGRLRLRAAGSAGGHNGLKSVIAQLGTPEFPRLKVGIGRPEIGDAIDYVLSDFPPDQAADLPVICDAAVTIAKVYLQDGILTAMNECNGVRDVRTQEERAKQPVRGQPSGQKAIGHEHDDRP